MIGADAGQCLHQGGDAALHGSTAAALAYNSDAEHAGRLDGLHKAVRLAAAQKYMGGAAVAVGVGSIDALAAGFQRDHDGSLARTLHTGDQCGQAGLQLCSIVGCAVGHGGWRGALRAAVRGQPGRDRQQQQPGQPYADQQVYPLLFICQRCAQPGGQRS